MWLTTPMRPRLLGDGDDFLHRCDDADGVVGFVADVAAVDAAELRRHPGHRDDFAGLRVRTRGVVEAARQPERAGAHALPHDVHHLRELLGVGIAIRHPHHRLANRSVRHHQADVETDALLVVARALRREIGRAAAIRIDEHGRDALREHRLPVLQFVGGQAAAGVRVDVDEAGRQRRGPSASIVLVAVAPSRVPTA